MKPQKGSLVFLATGGMELTWLFAWATFIMASILHRPFPLPEAIGTFVMAALFAVVVSGRGLRVILILGLQVFGFLLSTSRIVHVFFYDSHPFFDQWWLWTCFRQPKDPLEWFILGIILFVALVLWVGGVTFALRSAAYFTVCTRFDVGLAAFFCLFLAKFLLLVRGGIDIQNSTPELLLFPFFVFSLLSIGMARNQSNAQRDFLSGYRGDRGDRDFCRSCSRLWCGTGRPFSAFTAYGCRDGLWRIKECSRTIKPDPGNYSAVSFYA